jgi:N-acetylglucosamine-6-phosphate deacetylase
VTAVRGARLVLPDRVVEGWLHIEGDLIAGVEESAPPTDAHNVEGGYLVPGYIDVHCHGGAGADFASADTAQLAAASAFHARHGSAHQLASLVTAPVEDLCLQLEALADTIESGRTNIRGVHLEGPFLSHARCGAQNPAYLQQPSAAVLTELIEVARGTLSMITIAPELPRADEVIDVAVAAGVVVAVGHTDATYDEASAAFARGATVATHLCNGMRPVHHREPGPVLAALDAGVACEVINDGVHVHPAITRLVARRDPDQLIFITDAVSASGVGDGSFNLGGQEVTVLEGQARLTRTGALAGSTLTMDEAVRRGVVQCGLPLERSVAAATINPARLLGLQATAGSLAPGKRADLLHLDGDLRIVGRMCAGKWLDLNA